MATRGPRGSSSTSMPGPRTIGAAPTTSPRPSPNYESENCPRRAPDRWRPRASQPGAGAGGGPSRRGNSRLGEFQLVPERDALTGERELDFLARLVDAPLDRGERDLERVGDLRVREADDVAQKQRPLEIRGQIPDGAPHCVHRV